MCSDYFSMNFTLRVLPLNNFIFNYFVHLNWSPPVNQIILCNGLQYFCALLLINTDISYGLSEEREKHVHLHERMSEDFYEIETKGV